VQWLRWGLAVHSLCRLHRGVAAVSDVDERAELFGFFHEETFTSARQASDIRCAMAEFAGRWNYRLAKVFTAKPGDGSEAFEAGRPTRPQSTSLPPTSDED
jgi:hypothetical protein